MAYKAKSRKDANAYFAGWDAAAFDNNDFFYGKDRPSRGQYLGNLIAFDAGYHEYNFFVKNKEVI